MDQRLTSAVAPSPPLVVRIARRGTAVVVGLALITAAVLKLSGPPSGRPPLGLQLSPAWFQLAVAQYELFLGGWLLSGRHRSAAWLTTAGTFMAFAVVSFHSGWTGEASCGCFGAVPLRPWWAFAGDLLVLTALFVWADRPAIRNGEVAGPVLAFLAHAAIVLAAWTAFAAVRYGSTEVAVAALQGKPLVVGSSLLDLGAVPADEGATGTVVIHNRSGGLVRLIGGSTDCTCTLIQDLPLDVPPGESRTVTVGFRAPAGAGNFRHTGTIWTDCQSQQSLPVVVVGRSVAR